MDATTTTPPDTARVAVEVHPRAIRWMHWLNFPILSVMIWSGLRIYWSFDFTRVPGEFGDNNLFPNVFYEQLELDRSLAKGLSFHLSFGWLLVLNGIAYVLYLAFSKEWKHIVPRLADLKNIPATMLHEVGLRKEKPLHGQYNVMQQLAYTTVIIMAAIIVATGFRDPQAHAAGLADQPFRGIRACPSNPLPDDRRAVRFLLDSHCAGGTSRVRELLVDGDGLPTRGSTQRSG